MKRFYKLVSVHTEVDGFSVLLDGKPVRTPLRNILRVKTQALAQAIMQEWADQREKIEPETMPLTQIAATKIDRVAAERAAMEKMVLQYLDTDLLCYRTAQPPELAERQGALWDPWLTWFEQEFGVTLLTTNALAALKQPKAAHEGVRKYVQSLDDDHFTILQLVTGLSGSLILALGAVEGTGAEMLFDSMRVEERYKAELYNEEKYGPDPAQEKKDKAAIRDLQAAEFYLSALKI